MSLGNTTKVRSCAPRSCPNEHLLLSGAIAKEKLNLEGMGTHVGDLAIVPETNIHWGSPVNVASKFAEDHAENEVSTAARLARHRSPHTTRSRTIYLMRLTKRCATKSSSRALRLRWSMWNWCPWYALLISVAPWCNVRFARTHIASTALYRKLYRCLTSARVMVVMSEFYEVSRACGCMWV